MIKNFITHINTKYIKCVVDKHNVSGGDSGDGFAQKC